MDKLKSFFAENTDSIYLLIIEDHTPPGKEYDSKDEKAFYSFLDAKSYIDIYYFKTPDLKEWHIHDGSLISFYDNGFMFYICKMEVLPRGVFADFHK